MTHIQVLTGPVGIGKTTLLKSFVQQNSRIGGFLTIAKANNHRVALLFPNERIIDFSSQNIAEKAVAVGKFRFSINAFEQIWEHLNQLPETLDWYFFDEIGKLELEQNMGFEPVFSTFQKQLNDKWVLVIRSSLVSLFREKFPELNLIYNQGPWMPTVPSVLALLLAGGSSTRMQYDKRFIKYHQIPQWQYAAQQLQELELSVIISTQSNLESPYKELKDDPKFSECGPLSGILTAFEANPQNALLVLGVDYPQIKKLTLQNLIYTYQIRDTTVVYRNSESGMLEPLVAIFHPKHLEQIKQEFYLGNTSLRRWLEQHQDSIVVLPAPDSIQLKSFDYPSDEAAFRTH